jgi:hypothetical protein
LIELAASDTVTVATGAGVTVIVALPLFPSLVAMMFAVPLLTAVTSPVVDETVATPVLSELHVITRPVSVFPFASSVVAVACDVPTAVIEVGARLTVTEATGIGLTVIVGVGLELTDSLIAVIVAAPTPTAVTVAGDPLALTVSTDVLLEAQVIVRPVSTLPFASLVVAVSCCVAPTIICVVGAETVTVATGAGVTVSVALPVFPSLVAIIFAVPALIAVTSPVDGDTAATAVLSELHAIVRPMRIRPLESKSVAVAWVV